MITKIKTKTKAPKYANKYLAPKTYQCSGSWFKRKRSLILQKKNFEIITTTSSVIIKEYGNEKIGERKYIYMSDRHSRIRYREMNLRRELKKHVLENIEGMDLSIIDSKNINYTRIANWVYAQEKGAHIGEMVCFDINMAYYQCALILGFISNEFYTKCVNLPKQVRLRLIGSIATKKRKYSYHEGKISQDIDIIENKELRNCWNHIVNHVGRCMEELAKIAADKFVMYWVDGIYLKGKKEDWQHIIDELSSRWGFMFKSELIYDAILDFDDNLNAYRLVLAKESNYKSKITPFYNNIAYKFNNSITDDDKFILKMFYLKK